MINIVGDYMNNKKGFTLIELLAVIVILAILALIAVPITINIISDSRKNAQKRSIENYGKAVESAYVEAKMNRGNSVPNTISELDKIVPIKLSGKKVLCDEKINVTDNGITLTNCYVEDNKDESKKYDYVNGKIVEKEETKYKEYKINDQIYDKTNGEAYWVIANSDSKQDYVVALKAEPLTYDEVSSYNSEHAKHIGYWGNEQGALNYNGYAYISYYAGDGCWSSDHSGSADILCKSDYNESDLKDIVNLWYSKNFGLNDLKEVNNYKARLITNDEYQKIINYNWKSSYNDMKFSYWTMTSYTNNQVWIIKNDGNLSHVVTYEVRPLAFVRPVINIYKSAIK